VSDNILVQYVGFKAKALVREYTFSVREASSDPRKFTLTILNEAFNSHRARYQDAPDICSLKLHRELATYANHLLKTHYRITDAELDHYRGAHTKKAARNSHRHKAVPDF